MSLLDEAKLRTALSELTSRMERLDEAHEALSRGLLLANSGPGGVHEVTFRFNTLADMQEAHRKLVHLFVGMRETV
jgi:hypothetical protein